MSQKIAVIVIHGIGIQEPDFAKEAANKLKDEFEKQLIQENLTVVNAKKQLVIHPIHWAKVFEEDEEEFEKRLKGGGVPLYDKITNFLRRFMIHFVADALAYQPLISESASFNKYGRVALELAEKIGVNTKPGTEPRIKTVIEVDTNGKTNIDGIWAAGTVSGVSVHTIITADHGAAVAINVISQLNGERYVDHDVLKV